MNFHQYCLKNLIDELCSDVSSRDIIKDKPHIDYLNKYLISIGAKCFIVEDKYVDKDFLEDYSLYYSRCFKNYNRFCKRIHFFSTAYNKSKLESIFFDINRPENEISEIQESYLGFIVIKPLPKTVIGRTCLKTFAKTEDDNYFTTYTFHANLFGIDFTVKTLPFQEQDSVVAACATSALWSAFQITGELFDHKILSPSKITQYAVENRSSYFRPFPNTSGLTIEQMAHAIFKVELEPLYLNIASKAIGKELLLANLYAYMKFSIPVLFIVDLYDESNKQPKGRHAIAISGFKTNNTTTNNKELPLVSDRIIKLYGHDDQIGPFTTINYDSDKKKWYSSWKVYDDKIPEAKVEILPQVLLIPIYHKIRIPFETIRTKIYHFHNEFLLMNEKNAKKDQYPFEGIEWDICLISNNDLKKIVRCEESLDADIRKKLLLSVFPKYLWSATITKNNKPLATFIFDATDIEQGLTVLEKIPYDKEFNDVAKKLLITSLSDPIFKKELSSHPLSIVWHSYDECHANSD